MTKIEGLEGLRGYMAIWVWVTHVTTMAALPLNKNVGWGRILANGDLAVGVFIMLSGFVISASVLSANTRYSEYISRRALRLFPAYIVCLAVSIVILNISIDVLQSLPWDANRTEGRLAYLEASRNNFWPHLLLHSTLLHGLMPDSVLPYTSYAFMGQAWSLTLEWQFYLVAPFLLMAVERIKSSLLAILIVFLVLLASAMQFTQPSFLLSNLYFFFIGYVTYRLWYSKQSQEASWKPSHLLFLAAFVLVAAVLTKGIKGVAVAIWFVAIFSLQGQLGLLGRITSMIIDNRFARWLGSISYGFYCVHMISIFLCAYILLNVFRVESHAVYALLLIVFSLAFSILMAWLLYIAIERPFIAFGKALNSSRKAIQPAR